MNTEGMTYKPRTGWLRALGIVEMTIAMPFLFLALGFQVGDPMFKSMAFGFALVGVGLFVMGLGTVLLRWWSRTMAIAGYGYMVIHFALTCCTTLIFSLTQGTLGTQNWLTSFVMYVPGTVLCLLLLWFHTGNNVTATLLHRNPKARLQFPVPVTALMIFLLMSLLGWLTLLWQGNLIKIIGYSLPAFVTSGYYLLFTMASAVSMYGLYKRKTWGWFTAAGIQIHSLLFIILNAILPDSTGIELTGSLFDYLKDIMPLEEIQLMTFIADCVSLAFGLALLTMTRKFYIPTEE